jgi:hypothetical protein
LILEALHSDHWLRVDLADPDSIERVSAWIEEEGRLATAQPPESLGAMWRPGPSLGPPPATRL